MEVDCGSRVTPASQMTRRCNVESLWLLFLALGAQCKGGGGSIRTHDGKSQAVWRTKALLLLCGLKIFLTERKPAGSTR